MTRILGRFALGSAIGALALASLAVPPALAQAPVPAATRADKPAPLADLVKAVDIPYEQFTLSNGPARAGPYRPQGADRGRHGLLSRRLQERAQGQRPASRISSSI